MSWSKDASATVQNVFRVVFRLGSVFALSQKEKLANWGPACQSRFEQSALTAIDPRTRRDRCRLMLAQGCPAYAQRMSQSQDTRTSRNGRDLLSPQCPSCPVGPITIAHVQPRPRQDTWSQSIHALSASAAANLASSSSSETKRFKKDMLSCGSCL